MTIWFAVLAVAMFAALHVYGFYFATLDAISRAVADVPYIEAESDYQWRARRLRRQIEGLERVFADQMRPALQATADALADFTGAFTRSVRKAFR